MRLGDLQEDIARALIGHTSPAWASLLTGGGDSTLRFAVHSRHYQASLARSLVERFAATVWLVGSELVADAAMAFVREHPPTRPCIAEYGDAFPAYLAKSGASARLPYLAQFATMDWHLGRLAIAVDGMPLLDLAHCDPERIVDARLAIQTGTEYLALDWSLDELMSFYLSGNCPEQYALKAEPVWLELRGCRGELSMNRLTESEFAFRQAIARGDMLGEAVARALGIDGSFDPGSATRAMLQARLVTGVAWGR